MASETPQCVVNYIWLCPKSPYETFPHYATRLPLHNFERVYSNASRYPQAKFNLWLDFRQLTARDSFFLVSHMHAFGMGEIQVRNLCEIPAYKDRAGFEPDTDIALYARADFARVIVLNHLMDQPDKTAIYSDMDCEDISLSSNKLNDALDEYGLAYGRSGNHLVCNGYIALRGYRGMDFLQACLFPRTDVAFQKNRVNHFGAFSQAIDDVRTRHGFKTRLGVVDLPLMRTSIPYDESVYGRVSPISPIRVPGSLELV